MAACALLAAHSASADSTWNVATGNFTDGGNWTPGLPGTADNAIISNSGTATMSTGSISVKAIWVGNFADGTHSGTFKQTGGAVTLSDGIVVGRQLGATGTYEMTGGTLDLVTFRVGAGNASANGTMTVSGVGTTITSTGAGVTGVGLLGTGTLTLENSAVFNHNSTTAFLVGTDNASSGSNGGTGTLNVNSGAQLNIANGNLAIGRNNLGNGMVNVNGGAITLSNASAAINLGPLNGGSTGGTGTLTLTTGSISAPTLAFLEGTGTVNFDGGTATLGQIQKGAGASGSGTVNFNGTKIVASTSNADFMRISGAGTLTLNVKAGGLKLDTNGKNVGIQRVLEGVGGLVKQGAGTLTLSAANTYSGATVIEEGTLALANDERISDSSNLTLNSGTLDLGGFSEALGTLTLAATSMIDFGTSADANALTFADSSGVSWSGLLYLANFDVGSDVLKFGTTSGGLTASQLSAISLAGYTATGLDVNGVVLFAAVPEPAHVGALVAGLLGLIAACRRRSVFR